MNKRKGFTLIEMAVVLVIIGLILGAVSIGKDLQRNAEYKKIKQKFVDQWAQAYNQYYEKYGVVIGDDQTAPTLSIGGVATSISTAKAAGTQLEICERAANSQDPGGTESLTLHSYFDKAGIRMPPGRAEGLEDRYLYLDTNGNPMEIQICFQWNAPDTTSNAGNVMVVYGLTPDLARMLDQMIDGKADACEGMFRQQGATCTGTNAPGAAWSSDNTNKFGTTAGANLDEDQIAVVTAHYKMNQ